MLRLPAPGSQWANCPLKQLGKATGAASFKLRLSGCISANIYGDGFSIFLPLDSKAKNVFTSLDWMMETLNCMLRPSGLRNSATHLRQCATRLHRGPFPSPRRISQTAHRRRQLADDPSFRSILDNPPELVRTGQRHGPGLIILGTAQVYSQATSQFPAYQLFSPG